MTHLGPLRDGQTVAVVGGGPAGVACALTLHREAARRGLRLQILLFESKQFEHHFNQCAGVLSPPILRILHEEHDITLPDGMYRNEVQGYVLHGTREQSVLRGDEYHGVTQTVRRAEFDAFLANRARERGIEIVQAEVTDLEFRAEGVLVFACCGTFFADVVVGAFGTGRVMAETFARRVGYAPPPMLDTLVTKYHPGGNTPPIPGLLDEMIHAYLPPLPRVEFGSLIPKGNHVTVILAGRDLRSEDMRGFLALPQVRELVSVEPEPERLYKGNFPVGLARGFYGDRFVVIGDAAGLVRPFKGKGITSAFLTGGYAAQTMLDAGISRAAFRGFAQACAEITGDMLYGRLVRRLAWLTSHGFSLDPALRLAARDSTLRDILFDCVSGRDTYRHIVLRPGNLRLGIKLGLATLADVLRKK